MQRSTARSKFGFSMMPGSPDGITGRDHRTGSPDIHLAAIGSVERLMAKAKSMGQQWLQGIATGGVLSKQKDC
jgi:hypothetical protein